MNSWPLKEHFEVSLLSRNRYCKCLIGMIASKTLHALFA